MPKTSKRSGRADEPVRIKKYANRRLYNTETSTYVTLDDLAAMVRSERDFVVVDAKSGEDLTHSVLTQIILEQESKGQTLLPINFLRQLIRFYGHGMERLVPSYLDMSLDMLTRERERYRKQFTDTFAGTPLETLQKQAQQNMEMFERALSMFSPFPQTSHSSDDTTTVDTSDGVGVSRNNADQGVDQKKAEEADTGKSQIELLRTQLAAIEQQLNKLSR